MTVPGGSGCGRSRLGYLALLLLIPIGLIFYRTFENGIGAVYDSVTTPAAISAFSLTLTVTAIAVPLNTVFGVLCALALARGRFRGKAVLNAIIDLPFAISPVVVGLALILVFGRGGWLGDLPFQVIFSVPGIVLATIFISVPFVVREVTPVLKEVGDDQEQAASTLGAEPLAGLLAHHAAVDPLGHRLRRSAVGRALHRRVRCGVRGLRQDLRRDRDAHAAGGEALPELRPRGRVRGLRAARLHRARHAAGDDEDQPTEGRRMIAVRDVTKSFGDFVALDGVSLEIPDGSLTALLGPSGSGKSTLLRIIAGLEQPDSGVIEIHGNDATRVAPQRRGIGFVFQHYAAFKHMTVRDNVAFGMKIRKQPKERIRERVDELLGVVGLAGYHERYPNQLSGGQRQRMALARALAVEPKVLLLDEPFGALDAKVRAELREWLRRLHDEVHVTTVLVTHDQEEAMAISDHIAVMDNGSIEQVGGPRELYDQPANGFVMRFLGPVSQVGDKLVRPHDITILLAPEDGAREAVVERVVHLGFEVRVELRLDGEGEIAAQVTRNEADQLELAEGAAVWVRTAERRAVPA